MEFLKVQGRHILEQFRGLSASGRVALALLVVLLVGGLFGLVRWGSEPEWVDLMDQPLSAEQAQSIQTALMAAGHEARRNGDRLQVRADAEQRLVMKAMLAQQGAMPQTSALTYDALVKEDHPFESEKKTTWKQLRALETELSAVISHFQGVQRADVKVVVPQRRVIRTTQPMGSSASIALRMRPGVTLDKGRILAMAQYVAGAVPGLEPRQVTVTDGVQSYRAPEPDSGLSTEFLDIQRDHERHYTQKIYDHLRNVPGVVVNVHAQLRTTEEQVQDVQYTGEPAIKEETTESQASQGSPGASPGVRPNVGVGISGAGAGGSSTTDKTVSKFGDQRNTTQTQTVRSAGQLEQLWAAVTIPRSYLEQVFRTGSSTPVPSDKIISAAELEAIAPRELGRIRTQVQALLAVAGDDVGNQVAVDWYYDVPQDAPVISASQSTDYFAMARDYGPQAGLALLAAFSLFMMWRVAGRAQSGFSQKWATEGASGRSDSDSLEALVGGPAPVGEAQGMDALLVGREIDEATARTQQIVRQLGEMIREDPEVAASIVDHWLQEEN